MFSTLTLTFLKRLDDFQLLQFRDRDIGRLSELLVLQYKHEKLQVERELKGSYTNARKRSGLQTRQISWNDQFENGGNTEDNKAARGQHSIIQITRKENLTVFYISIKRS